MDNRYVCSLRKHRYAFYLPRCALDVHVDIRGYGLYLALRSHATRSHAAKPYATEAHTTESHTTEGESSNFPAEPIVALALNKMIELLQQMSKGNRREEHRLELEEDYALERFLRFHPLIYQGKADSERKFDL
jgi:hypothetical protein